MFAGVRLARQVKEEKLSFFYRDGVLCSVSDRQAVQLVFVFAFSVNLTGSFSLSEGEKRKASGEDLDMGPRK